MTTTLKLNAITLAALTILGFACSARASTVVPSNFNGFGTVVNGYQDFFTSPTLNPAWQVVGGNPGDFTLSNGTLLITGSGGDPNKLLYNPTASTYSGTDQSILAMIRVQTPVGTNNDSLRGGVATQSNLSNGKGYDLLFRQNGNNGDSNNSGNHFDFLDDGASWGPSNIGTNAWNANQYYWVRETTTGNTITGEIWAADGVTPESSAITATWSRTDQSGLAGLVADSGGGDGDFQVNYVLIEAAGLPQITAGVPVPEPSSIIALAGMAGIGLIGLVGYRRRHCGR